MSRVRKPANKEAQKPLPHEPAGDHRQPYSKENAEYSGASVIKPPEPQVATEEKVGERDGSKSPPRKP